jgi:hypothetical protein
MMETDILNKKHDNTENQRNHIIQEPIQRQTAFKLRIVDLLRGNVIANDKFRFLELDDKKIVRVNIIANIIDKFVSEGEKKYAGITLDDASGQIRVKTFGDDVSILNGLEIGNTIGVIGVLRYFNNELYVLPETVRRLDPRWLIVRKLELGHKLIREETITENKQTEHKEAISSSIENEIQKVSNSKQEVNIEKIEDGKEKHEGNEKLEIKNKILEMVRANDEGIDVDKIIMSLNYDVDAINMVITEMLEDAEVYEPKPGRIRIL